MSSNKGKRNVAYTKPPEPSFLRKIKEKVGYKEGPNIDTKREQLPVAESDEEDRTDDEKPLVVVLNEGDLTAEEAEAAMKEQETQFQGKPKFHKPSKRTNDEDQNPLRTSTKKAKAESSDQKTARSRGKKVKNSSLLSFEVEEDDDQD